MKICNACKQLKELSEFGNNKSMVDGLMPQCKKCNSNRVSKYYKKNPQKVDNLKRKIKRHNLSKDDYDILNSLYNGMCHICKTNIATTIDHDHKCCNGSYSCGDCIRGLLCSKCNMALGLFNDNIGNLKNAIKYLLR